VCGSAYRPPCRCRLVGIEETEGTFEAGVDAYQHAKFEPLGGVAIKAEAVLPGKGRHRFLPQPRMSLDHDQL
jgi:hypothetical protein